MKRSDRLTLSEQMPGHAQRAPPVAEARNAWRSPPFLDEQLLEVSEDGFNETGVDKLLDEAASEPGRCHVPSTWSSPAVRRRKRLIDVRRARKPLGLTA